MCARTTRNTAQVTTSSTITLRAASRTYLTALCLTFLWAARGPLSREARSRASSSKLLVPFQPKHCYHMGPLTLADGSPNYDPDGKLKCSDAEECPAQTDFVLGEPTGEFLASMHA